MSMNQQHRVLLLIPHLGGGGAEQVAALLARHLSPQRYEVHLGVVTQAAVEPGALPPWVRVHPLGAPRVRSAAVGLLGLVRRLKPEVILSGMAHLNFLVLLLRPFFGKGTCVLVRQNGSLSSSLAFGELPGYTGLLYRLLYPHADRVICQTRAMAEDLAAGAGIRPHRLVVLPNPVDVDAIHTVANQHPDPWSGTGPGPHLVAVGRLARVKGFDLLLQALPEVRRRFPTADLVIAGAGPEEAKLRAQATSLGLEGSVRLAGHVEPPWSYFAGATLFTLSSRHEGLPNAMLEAAAGGLPIVALPSSRGVVELVQGQPGVWVAAEISASALAASLLAALESLRPGERFVHPLVEQFALRYSIQTYEQLIDATLRERRP